VGIEALGSSSQWRVQFISTNARIRVFSVEWKRSIDYLMGLREVHRQGSPCLLIVMPYFESFARRDKRPEANCFFALFNQIFAIVVPGPGCQKFTETTEVPRRRWETKGTAKTLKQGKSEKSLSMSPDLSASDFGQLIGFWVCDRSNRAT
jgi:hypothetical protein